jgi:hypothetical protein
MARHDRSTRMRYLCRVGRPESVRCGKLVVLWRRIPAVSPFQTGPFSGFRRGHGDPVHLGVPEKGRVAILAQPSTSLPYNCPVSTLAIARLRPLPQDTNPILKRYHVLFLPFVARILRNHMEFFDLFSQWDFLLLAAHFLTAPSFYINSTILLEPAATWEQLTCNYPTNKRLKSITQ